MQDLGFQARPSIDLFNDINSESLTNLLFNYSINFLDVSYSKNIIIAYLNNELKIISIDLLSEYLESDNGKDVDSLVLHSFKVPSNTNITQIKLNADNTCLYFISLDSDSNKMSLNSIDLSILLNNTFNDQLLYEFSENEKILTFLPSLENPNEFICLSDLGHIYSSNKSLNITKFESNAVSINWFNNDTILYSIKDSNEIILAKSNDLSKINSFNLDLEKDQQIYYLYQYDNSKKIIVVTGENISADENSDFTTHFIDLDEGNFKPLNIKVSTSLFAPYGAIPRIGSFYISNLNKWSKEYPDLFVSTGSKSVDIDFLIPNFSVELLNDSDRATMPIDSEGSGDDDTPLGMILDLNSKINVKEPCKGIDESDPLPRLVILTNRGQLISWNIWSKNDIVNKTTNIEAVKNEIGKYCKATTDDNNKVVELPKDKHNDIPDLGGLSFGGSSNVSNPFGSSSSSMFSINKPKNTEPASNIKPASSFTFNPSLTTPAVGSFKAAETKPISSTTSSPFGSLGSKPSLTSNSGSSAFGASPFGSNSFKMGNNSSTATNSHTFGASSFATKPPATTGANSNNKTLGQGGFGKFSTQSGAFGSIAKTTNSSSPFGAISANKSENIFGGATTNKTTDSPFGAISSGNTKSIFGSTSNNNNNPFSGPSKSDIDEKKPEIVIPSNTNIGKDESIKPAGLFSSLRNPANPSPFGTISSESKSASFFGNNLQAKPIQNNLTQKPPQSTPFNNTNKSSFTQASETFSDEFSSTDEESDENDDDETKLQSEIESEIENENVNQVESGDDEEEYDSSSEFESVPEAPTFKSQAKKVSLEEKVQRELDDISDDDYTFNISSKTELKKNITDILTGKFGNFEGMGKSYKDFLDGQAKKYDETDENIDKLVSEWVSKREADKMKEKREQQEEEASKHKKILEHLIKEKEEQDRIFIEADNERKQMLDLLVKENEIRRSEVKKLNEISSLEDDMNEKIKIEFEENEKAREEMQQQILELERLDHEQKRIIDEEIRKEEERVKEEEERNNSQLAKLRREQEAAEKQRNAIEKADIAMKELLEEEISTEKKHKKKAKHKGKKKSKSPKLLDDTSESIQSVSHDSESISSDLLTSASASPEPEEVENQETVESTSVDKTEEAPKTEAGKADLESKNLKINEISQAIKKEDIEVAQSENENEDFAKLQEKGETDKESIHEAAKESHEVDQKPIIKSIDNLKIVEDSSNKVLRTENIAKEESKLGNSLDSEPEKDIPESFKEDSSFKENSKAESHADSMNTDAIQNQPIAKASSFESFEVIDKSEDILEEKPIVISTFESEEPYYVVENTNTLDNAKKETVSIKSSSMNESLLVKPKYTEEHTNVDTYQKKYSTFEDDEVHISKFYTPVDVPSLLARGEVEYPEDFESLPPMGKEMKKMVYDIFIDFDILHKNIGVMNEFFSDHLNEDFIFHTLEKSAQFGNFWRFFEIETVLQGAERKAKISNDLLSHYNELEKGSIALKNELNSDIRDLSRYQESLKTLTENDLDFKRNYLNSNKPLPFENVLTRRCLRKKIQYMQENEKLLQSEVLLLKSQIYPENIVKDQISMNLVLSTLQKNLYSHADEISTLSESVKSLEHSKEKAKLLTEVPHSIKPNVSLVSMKKEPTVRISSMLTKMKARKSLSSILKNKTNASRYSVM